jgi:hypothetical protein
MSRESAKSSLSTMTGRLTQTTMRAPHSFMIGGFLRIQPPITQTFSQANSKIEPRLSSIKNLAVHLSTKSKTSHRLIAWSF